MRLTRFTDLALRVLMLLATRPAGEITTVAEIAVRIGWTHNHVVKVVHQLGRLGWVVNHRGRSGGVELSPDSRALRLGDVVRTLEEDDPLVNCADPACGLAAGCRLSGILRGGLEAFYAELNRFTLADLAGPGDFAALFAGAKVIPIRPETAGRPAAAP